MRHERSAAFIIIIAVFLAALPRITASIYTPSMPSLVGYFGTSEAAVQWTFSSYIIGLALGQIIYGPLSDAWGRRPVILAGLFFFTLTSSIIAFAPSIFLLGLGRFVEAISAASGGVLARAIVRDLMGPASTVRAIAYVTMATTLSPAVGPLVGGQLEHHFGWQANFLALGAAGFALALVCFFMLPETRRPEHAAPSGIKGMMYGFVKLLRAPAFLAYSFSGGFLLSMQLVFYGSAPFLFIKLLDISPRDYGFYTVTGVAGFMIGNFIVTRTRDLTDTARMVLIGSIVAFTGAFMMMVLTGLFGLSVWGLIGPFTLATMGSGIAMPNAMAGSLNRYPEIAGTSSSLSGFIGMILAAGSTASLGLLLASSGLPATILMTILAAIALVVAFINPERRRAKEESAPSRF